jgi:microcystin-dependent protein
MGVRTEAPTTTVPNGGFIAGANIYVPKNPAAAPNAGLNATTIGFGQGAATDAVGGSQPHANMQPYLVLRYVIALSGVFPSRN